MNMKIIDVWFSYDITILL